MTHRKDTSGKDATVTMLEKHHRDGAAFAEQMETTFSSRFNEDFWNMWSNKIEPTLPENFVAVDFGTGPATFVKTLAARYITSRVIGVEYAPYMIAAVGKLPANAQLLEADLQKPDLAIADNSVDIAISSVVVHEMIQPVRMFREIQRILKPGSLFYLYDWVRVPFQLYLKNSDINPFDDTISQEALEDLFIHFIEHNRFSFDDVQFMLMRTGFTIVDSGFKNEKQHAWVLARK